MVLYSASRRLSSAALSAASDALPSPGSTRMAAPDGSPASGSCKCRTIFGRQHRDAAGLVVRHRSPGRGCCDSLCRGELFEEPSTAFAPLAIRPPGAPSAPRPPCSSVHCCVPAAHFQNTLNDVSIRTMNNNFFRGTKTRMPSGASLRLIRGGRALTWAPPSRLHTARRAPQRRTPLSLGLAARPPSQAGPWCVEWVRVS